MSVLLPRTIRTLAERDPRDGSPILSVYLNLDPSHPLVQKGGYKLVLDGILKEIESQIQDETRLNHFEEDADWVRRKAEYYLPKGKSLVLFCDVSESFFFEEALPIRMANQAWYGSTPYVRPLIEALEEYERYGAVLLDRERARFFVITMGSIEEVSDVFQDPPVKHRSMAGSDHMRSQMVLQRRAAKWSESFLKDASDRLNDMVRRYDIDGVLLAGPEDVTAELLRMLPKRVASRVVQRMRMAVQAKPSEVLDLSFPIIEQIENQQERSIVGDLITIARKANPTMEKAVLGINGILDAVNQGRVQRLLYPRGGKIPGFQCTTCDVLLDHPPAHGKCPYCSHPLTQVEDLVWLASERVLAMGGKIQEIRDKEAQDRLRNAGAVGAFLR